LTLDGRVIGRGAHVRAGEAHAEALAIEDAARNGEATKGATAYVTLEPCCHYGRTPPCTDALLRAGVARAVVGVRDRNPKVAGGGVATLAAGGVEVVEGVLGDACARLHAPFFKLVATGLPWVALKLALGSDGGVGPKDTKTNITAPEVQKMTHALRRVSDGILVGRGTIEIDNPRLTDRWPAPPGPRRVFRRIVLDSRGSLAPDRRVWQGVDGHSMLRALTQDAPPIEGVEDLRLPPGPGGCSLRSLLREAALKGVCRILAEGGPTLAARLLAEGLVDVLHVFRNDRSAGGQTVTLDAAGSGRCQWTTCAAFDGGHWERAEFGP
jgi:diaminohydroxyphosphoribosylaminopyrimidine deaminase/5-amino-6-(5-phosphoribosylamino)uracil reductase